MQSSGDAGRLSEQERWLLKYSQPANVKMIGVWDTVGSVGLAAGNIAGISRSQFDYLQTGLRIHILNGYHAIAIDEHRNDFAPTLWTVRHPKDPKAVIARPRSLSAVEQRWFVGAHANVGGGYETDLLNQAPLRWLMRKAESHGSGIGRRLRNRADHRLLRKVRLWDLPWISSPLHRPVGADPEERDDGTHPTVNETIDVSVFKRWRADAAYRPANLVDWAKRKKVDPAELQTSVEAGDPHASVPDR